MFWKRKKSEQPNRPEELITTILEKDKTDAEKLEEAAGELASSLFVYSDAAYRALQSEPNAELVSAYEKMAAATKIVTEGRLAYALGRCLPDHVKHWGAWSQRDDFENWVGFNASEIVAEAKEEEDGSRTIKTLTVDFIFNSVTYRLILRDFGMSYAPGEHMRFGEIELVADSDCVAKFGLVEDCSDHSKDYSEWEFSEVRTLKVGEWMKDVLDIAAQIQNRDRERRDSFSDQMVLEAADEIDLG